MKAQRGFAGLLSAVKREKCVCSGLAALVWLAGCTRQIDFENDVPQRAKAISQQEVAAIRRTMNTEKSQRQYQEYMREAQVKGSTEQKLRDDLARLGKELRKVEADVASVKGSSRKDLQRQVKQLKAEIAGLRTRLSYIESGKAYLKAHPVKVNKGKGVPKKVALRKQRRRRKPLNRATVQATQTPQVQETAPVEGVEAPQVVSEYPNNGLQPGVVLQQPGAIPQSPQILVQPQLANQPQILQQPLMPQSNLQQVNPGLLTTVR